MKAEVIVSPLAVKEFVRWFNTHLSDFEKVFGEIKSPMVTAVATDTTG
jgi:hypothetical protein